MRYPKIALGFLAAALLLITIYQPLESKEAKTETITEAPKVEVVETAVLAEVAEPTPQIQLAVAQVKLEPVKLERTDDKLSAFNVLLLINEMREANGIAPVVQDNTLTVVANIKAEDMVERAYFSHVDPDGNKIFPTITKSGYSYQFAGENLGLSYTSSQALVEAWMLSETHRINLLNPRFDDIGIAIVYGEYQGYPNVAYIVTIYGSKD